MADLYPIILTGKTMDMRLENHTLPAPPLTFNTGVTIKKNYYPGNMEPTVQVLNSKYGELEFSGKFMDSRAGESGFAEERRNRLQDMKDLAEEITMTYASQIFIGLIEEVTFSTYNIREIEYKIKFNVFYSDVGRVNALKKVNRKPDVNKVKENASLLATAVSAMSDLSDKVKSLHTTINSKIAELKEVSGVDSVNSIISDANDILMNIKSFNNELDKITPSNLINSVNLSALRHNLSNTRQETQTLIKDSTSYSNSQQGIKSKYTIYVVGKDDTLYTLSNKFYDDSTYWYKIAKANKLTKMELTMGQKLVIPE